MSDIDRAHSRELAATGRIADNVEESVKVRLGSRRSVQSAIVVVKGSYDVRLKGAKLARCVGAVKGRGDSPAAVLKQGVVAVDCQRAAAAALPFNQCVVKRRDDGCLRGPEEQERED